MNAVHSAVLVAVMALVTAALRFLPFLVFRSREDTPRLVTRLGALLPGAVMGMLVVYCLRNVSIRQAPHGLPELIAAIVTAALHIWKRNTLLSILAGTVTYMILIQKVFLLGG